MSNIKKFSRAARQEINRISISLKQLEFKILQLRGFLKKKLRKEIQELKRMKDNIIQKLYHLNNKSQLNTPAIQLIRQDIGILNERCQYMKTQKF